MEKKLKLKPKDDIKEEQLKLNPDEEDIELPDNEFSFLVKDLSKLDIEGIYESLKSKIKLGKKRLDPDVLSEAIDEAPELAFSATQLYLYAKEKLSKFTDLTFRIKYAELANTASAALEKEKKEKKLTGQITKEKIENWIVLNNSGYKKLLKEKREMELAVEIFKSLSAQFESRKSLLQTQGRLSERKKVFVGASKGGE